MYLAAILIEYGKGKSTASPSQTVFHNVCSGHAVLFLYFHDVDRGERHRATTSIRASQKKVYSTLLCL